MKCEGCGYELHIEDKVCPHCGRENPYYQQYRADQSNYESELESTRQSVTTKSKIAAGRLIKVVVLVLLLAAEVLLLLAGIKKTYVQTEAASEEEAAEAQESVAEEEEKEEAIALLWQYEEAENYLMFYKVYYHYALWDNGALNGQNYLADMGYAVSEYGLFFSYLIDYLTDEDRDYAWHRMAETTYSFYYQIGITEKRVAEVALHAQVIEDMKAEMEAILVTYAGLDPETAAGLEDMTQEEITAVFEEAAQ